MVSGCGARLGEQVGGGGQDPLRFRAASARSTLGGSASGSAGRAGGTGTTYQVDALST